MEAEYLVPTYRFGSLEVGSYKFTLTITDNNDSSTVFQQEYTIQVNPKAEVVIQPEEGAPSVSLSVPEEELLEAVLTEEEIAAGAQVRITVAKAEPSTEELALFTNAMNGYKECLYLDISLAKVSGNAVTAITEVPGGIRLVLTQPTELQ